MKKMLLILLLGCFLEALAQSASQRISQGNQYYRRANYDLAENEYRLALRTDPKNETALYNLANTLQKQKRYQEAIEVLGRLNAIATEPQVKGPAHYNTGVAYTKQKRLDESIESYKEALRINPNDQEARENLQKALMEKKKQQQQQQQQQSSSSSDKSNADQKLEQLHEKEKKINARLQNRQGGRPQQQDW